MVESRPGDSSAAATRRRGVPVWLVVVGALAACLAIFVVIVGVIVINLFDRNDEGIKREALRARKQGGIYGRSHTQRQCVQETLSRLDTAGFLQQIHEGLFLDACLKTARPTENFCKEVPPESEILRSVLWRRETCSAYGQPDNQECARLMGKVQQLCHPTSLSRPVDSLANF